MTVYELKNKYYEHHPNGHYFDQEALQFFGERLSEMRVLENIVVVKDYNGVGHKCYKLSKLSRNCPGGARRTYAYFDCETFDQIEGY